MNYLGDFAEDATVRILFTTAAAAGGAVAPSSAFEADDIRIYKNNGATQKATTNGITITSPFDSVTGLHALDIDTSNDTGDSGFWTSGAEYSVVAVPDETVDSQTVVSVIATFSIENRHANLRAILGSKLTETSAGYLTAGFKKLYNVASPVFTLASVNQTGDAYGQTNQLINGSAWVEMFGPRQVAIPQSGSRTHRIFFAVRNGRGALTAATSLSVAAATDLAGNNVAANCSAFTTVITGIYYLDYTVANTHAETIVSVFVSGVANSSALYFQGGFAVGRFDSEDELLRYDPPTNAEMEARTLEAADYATSTALSAVASNANTAASQSTTAATQATTAAMNTTTLLSRVTTGAAQLFTDLIAMITGSNTPDPQWTADALALGPSGGGGGGGDATAANQILILDQLDVIQAKTDQIGSASAATSLLAGAVLVPGTITSFPEVLTIGDSYTENNGREIQIPIVDTDGNPISSTGSLNFADATVTFAISRANETDASRIITGTAEFVDPPGTGTGAGAPYVIVQLPSSETSKGLTKYKYSGVLTFTWSGTGTDVMSFETATITFDN